MDPHHPKYEKAVWGLGNPPLDPFAFAIINTEMVPTVHENEAASAVSSRSGLEFKKLTSACGVAELSGRAHDDEIFAVELDFGAGIFAEQDAVAFFHIERTDLAF